MQQHQLRVRLGKGLYAKLRALTSTRGAGETVSDVVRHAIEAYVGPELALAENVDFTISDNAKCAVKRLAGQLDRTPSHVIEDCVEGIIELFERQKTPLIILELDLRKKYLANKKRNGEPVRRSQ